MGLTIDLTFDPTNNPTPAFEAAVTSAATILEKAITDNITINIDVGYGIYPGPGGGTVTGGSAEGGVAGGDFYSYSTVVSALKAEAAPGDTNFSALPSGTTVSGYNGSTTESYSEVYVPYAEEKALGLMSANGSEIDGYAGFATDIPTSELVGVALHELTHAMGRVPFGLPYDYYNYPNVWDLFRFDSANGERLIYDNVPSPSAYFSVNGGITNLVDYGVSSDPSDFLYSSAPEDSFDEYYDSNTFQYLTQVDLTQLDVLGFNTETPTISWATGVSGNFAVAANWNLDAVPGAVDDVKITAAGTYTVSSTADESVDALTTAHGATLAISGSTFTIGNGGANAGTIAVGSGGTLVLDGVLDNTGLIETISGTIELSGRIISAGTDEIGNGGRLIVASGGVASGTVVATGGTEVISTGGVDFRASISGGTQVIDGGGTAVGTIIEAGAELLVEAGGFASSATVTSGGTLALFGDAAQQATTVSSGGVVEVGFGAAVSDFTVGGGAILDVASGGTAIDTTISGGTEHVRSGAAVTGPIAFANAGGTVEIDDTTSAALSSLTLDLAGKDFVDLTQVAYSAGATAFISGADLVTSVGGRAYEIGVVTSVSLAADRFIVTSDGATGTDVEVIGPTTSTVSKGHTYFDSSTTDVSDVVESGGTMVITSGGLATLTTVEKGGVLILDAGGTALGLTNNGTVLGEGGVISAGTGTIVNNGVLDPGSTPSYGNGGQLGASDPPQIASLAPATLVAVAGGTPSLINYVGISNIALLGSHMASLFAAAEGGIGNASAETAEPQTMLIHPHA